MASFPALKPSEFHVHTVYSDGNATVLEMVEAAVFRGLETIALTDHTEPWKTKTKNWFLDYLHDIEDAKKRFGNKIAILAGVEAPVMDFNGKVMMTDEMKEKASFVIGSVHRYPGTKGRKIGDLDKDTIRELEYKALMALAGNNHIHVIGHIGGTCSQFGVALYAWQVRAIVKKAVANNIAIEINSKWHPSITEMLGICTEENAAIFPGSDAHTPERVGECFRVLNGLGGIKA